MIPDPVEAVQPDLSIVLNAHDESGYLLRTLRSTEEAARFARSLGERIELVVVLDRPSTETAELVGRYLPSAFDRYRSIVVDHGSLGPSRSAGIAAATGEYVALCDADDLISFNAFGVALEVARRGGPTTVVAPEYLFGFGQNHDVCRYSDSEIVTPFRFLWYHPYTSRILARRDLLQAVPFTDVRLGTGYAYEDWHLNCDLLASGARFAVAPDTILFHRRRPRSLSTTAGLISTGQIPPSRLFEPDVFLGVAAAAMDRYSEADAGWEDVEAVTEDVSFLRSPQCRELVHAANRLDPAITLACYATSHWQATRSWPVHRGVAYYRLCRALGTGAPFTDIVLASGETSADDVRSVCDVLRRIPRSRVLVLAQRTEDLQSWNAWHALLPDGSMLLATQALHGQLSDDDVDVLCLKLIQSSATTARVHLGGSSFGRRFWQKYGGLLEDNHSVLHRMCEGRTEVEGRSFVLDDDAELISEARHTLRTILVHDERLMHRDQARIGIDLDKWQLVSPASIERLEGTTLRS